MPRKQLLSWWLRAWGASLGFVSGAAAMAYLARWLGWWPPSSERLRRFRS